MAIMILGWAVQRAAVGITYYAEAREPLLVGAYVIQGACGVLLWASLLWARRLIAAATALLGVSVAATATLAGFVLERWSPTTAIFQIIAALILSVAFIFFSARVRE
jgi:hypothetical protein